MMANQTFTQYLSIAFSLALVASCDLDTNAEDGIEVVAQQSQVEDERDLVDLYHELAARLDERGVTLAQMRDAVDARDEARICRLFGYTPRECDVVYARFQVLTEGPERDSSGPSGGGGPGEDLGPPIQQNWLKCHPGLALCALTAAERAYHYPGKVGLGIFVIGGLACVWVSCSYDGTGPGTWTSRP